VSSGFLTASGDAHEWKVCDFVFQIGDQWSRGLQLELCDRSSGEVGWKWSLVRYMEDRLPT